MTDTRAGGINQWLLPPPPWVPALKSSSRAPPTCQFKPTFGGPPKLHPFQRAAVNFILGRGGRGLLGHEMGLGKTPMALAIVAHFLSEAPVLIVAPSILLGQWASELLMWLPDTKRSDVQVIKAGKDAIDPSAKFVIVSYGLVTGQKGSNAHLRVTASGGAYKVIVCDECHALKQMNSQRTQAILPMLERAKRVVLMSGTPLSNCSAQDLYPIVSAIAGRGCMPSLLSWNSRYCEANKKIFTGHTYVDRWVGISEENGTELHELLSHIMVRKLESVRNCRRSGGRNYAGGTAE